MCGIVGYIGNKTAAKLLLPGLLNLEYRGYDSAGIAVKNGNEEPLIVKAKGKLKNLIARTDNGRTVPGYSGLRHTCLAIHGKNTISECETKNTCI